MLEKSEDELKVKTGGVWGNHLEKMFRWLGVGCSCVFEEVNGSQHSKEGSQARGRVMLDEAGQKARGG